MDPNACPTCILCRGPLVVGLNTDFCSLACEQAWDELFPPPPRCGWCGEDVDAGDKFCSKGCADAAGSEKA